MEIVSTSNSKQTKPQSFSETHSYLSCRAFEEWFLRINMSIYRKKENISKHLQWAFYLFGIEADLEAIKFSYFLGLIKALIAQLLINKNIMSAVDI